MSVWSQFRMDASRHVSRGAGQSAVAAAAYRSGERLFDERAAEAHDYTGRYGVVATGIVMPERGGPMSASRAWTREELWNAAEAAERRKDSRTARKIEMALPAAMTAEQRREGPCLGGGDRPSLRRGGRLGDLSRDTTDGRSATRSDGRFG